jgi:pilus assembly protein Flp/PilA
MLNHFNGLLAKLIGGTALRDEGGQTYVEYALLIAFIAVVALVAVQLLGHSISSLFSSVGSSL